MSLEKLLERVATEPADDPQEDLKQLRDAFVQRAGRVRHAEVVKFAQLVGPLLQRVPLIQRIAFARQIAANRATPSDLLQMLAFDHYMVSAPVLESAPLLPDDVLVKVIEARGEEVMLAIAKRKPLPLQVTDMLVESSCKKILTALAENPMARISRRGVQKLVEHAKGDDKLSGLLARRPDTRDAMMTPKAPPEAAAANRGLRSVPTATSQGTPGRGRAAFVMDKEMTQKAGSTQQRPVKVFRYS